MVFALRDSLRGLYSVIKGQDAHIKFALLTGVSKFSKVSLFYSLNNLNEITIDFISIEFSKASRNIAGFAVATLAIE